MFYPTLCLKMGTYFQDVFELNTAEHKLLRFAIPHLAADSTWSNRIVSLDTCILCDEKSLGKSKNWTFRGYKFALWKEEKREQFNTIHALNSQ